ncbi:MAG: PH domain-containing protein [Allomuricauda sp.]
MAAEFVKYRSKVGIGLLLFVLVSFGIGGYYLILDWKWGVGLIHFGALALILYLFFSISYVITGKELLINYGAFYQKKIIVGSITRIKETRNPLSSPAASLDRLEISYDSGFILVSPKNKKGFIDHIKSLVPEVSIEMRN